jgi:hypothetical protein
MRYLGRSVVEFMFATRVCAILLTHVRDSVKRVKHVFTLVELRAIIAVVGVFATSLVFGIFKVSRQGPTVFST